MSIRAYNCFASKPDLCLFTTGVTMTIVAVALLAISQSGVESALFNTTTADYYTLGLVTAIFVTMSSFKRKKSFILSSSSPEAVYKKITQSMYNYLEKAKKEFDTKPIFAEPQDYVFRTLENFFKIYNKENLTYAKPQDITAAFQCLAIQLMMESRPEPEGCGHSGIFLNIKGAITLKNPMSIFIKENSPSPSQPGFFDDFLGVWTLSSLKQQTGLESFSLGALRHSIGETSFVDLLTGVRSMKSDPHSRQLRFLASQLQAHYWLSFTEVSRKRTTFDIVAIELENQFRRAVREGYADPGEDGLASAFNIDPLVQLAILEIVNQCEFQETAQEQILTLPNGQRIRNLKKHKWFFDKECRLPIEWASSPNPLAALNRDDPLGSISIHAFQLKKALCSSQCDLKKIKSILKFRSAIAHFPKRGSAEEPSFLSKDQVNPYILKVLQEMGHLSQGIMRSSYITYATQHFGQPSRKYFDTESQFMETFKSRYLLSPRDVSPNPTCLADALSFCLLGGDVTRLREAREYDVRLRQTIARMRQQGHVFDFSSMRTDTPWTIAFMIGNRLERTAERFLECVGNHHSGAWVTISEKDNPRYVSLEEELTRIERNPSAETRKIEIRNELKKMKFQAIKSHVQGLLLQSVYVGEPELQLFAEVYKCNIHFFEGNPSQRYVVTFDTSGNPRPRVISPTIPTPHNIHLVFSNAHFTGLVPKATASRQPASRVRR